MAGSGLLPGLQLGKITPDGAAVVEPQPRHGSELVVATQNLCDITAWWASSTRINDLVVELEGDGVTAKVNTPIVDLLHGKVHSEDDVSIEQQQDALAQEPPGDPHGYLLVVRADDVVLAPRQPFADAGGDYTVDYKTGDITFAQDRTGQTIKVSYSKPQSSTWILKPYPGKKLRIEQAAAQFTTDIVMNGTLKFSVWGYVIAFAPELAQSNGGPYPDTTLIGLLSERYKTIQNFIEEALGAFPGIPAFGGAKRGLASNVYEFPFRYGTTRDLFSSAGMELHVDIENDVPYDGTLANATFYCTVDDDENWPAG